MKKISFTLLFCAAIVKVSFSQHFLDRYTQGITPMHKFFQQYADTTIIMEYANAPDAEPSFYRLISKTGNFINTFTYEPIDTTWKQINSIKSRKIMPIILWHQLSSKKLFVQRTPPDINIFFNSVILSLDSTKKIWYNLTKCNPWQLVDDKTFGHGCKDVEDPVTSESGPFIIHLITKKEIKTLFFMTPYYFEKLCPGNKNRQAIIKINEIFNINFPKFKGEYY